MKTCIKCGLKKPLSEYYKNHRMSGGYVNKCKDCTKSYSTNYRNKNIEKIRAYDRARGNRQDVEYCSEYRKKNPKKYKAHKKVAYQVKAGNLTPKPCEVCGEQKTVAHHDDYDKPLDVRWLCYAHHKQWHVKNGEGLNAR